MLARSCVSTCDSIKYACSYRLQRARGDFSDWFGACLRGSWGVWIFHLYPSLFLAVAVNKRGSALPVYYGASTFLLVHVSTSPVLLDSGGLRLLYKVFAVISMVLLFLSSIFHICLGAGLTRIAKVDVIGLLPPAARGVRGDGTNPQWFLQEFTIALASVFTWFAVNVDSETVTSLGPLGRLIARVLPTQTEVTSRTSRRVSLSARLTLRGVPLLTPPLLKLKRFIQLSLWLIFCAALDCSVFGALYMLAAVALVAMISAWPPSESVIGKIRKALLGYTQLHLFVTCACSCFAHRFSKFPFWLEVVWGDATGALLTLQCCCVLVLIVELLRAGGVDHDIPSRFAARGFLEEDADVAFDSMNVHASSSSFVDRLAVNSFALLTLVDEEDNDGQPSSRMLLNRISRLLSATSFGVWTLIWPIIPSLPLLLAGLVALEKPLHEGFPKLVQGLACYEAILCAGCFAGSVWYDAREALPRWEEGLGVSARFFEIFSLPVKRGVVLIVFALLTLALSFSTQLQSSTADAAVKRHTSRRATPSQSQWRSQALLVVRTVMVLAVVMLALIPGPEGESSLVQVGYLLWFLILVSKSDELPVALVGWDILRGNVMVWRLLQVYCALVGVLVLLWQALAFGDLHFLGLTNLENDNRYLRRLWIHLALSVLAATQARVMQFPSAQRRSFFVEIKAPVRLLLNFGLLALMGFLLYVALKAPFCVEALALLVAWAIVLGVAQFSTKRVYTLPILSFTAGVAMALLMIRSFISLSFMQAWFQEVFPEDQHKTVWASFSLKSKVYDQSLQYFIAFLVLFARALISCFKLALLNLDDNLYHEAPSENFMWLLRSADLWFPVILILVAYILVASRQKLDVLSSIQLLVLECSLIVGKGWDLAGAFLSICSMVLILAQYTFSLPFAADVIQGEYKSYWGLEWTSPAARRELAVLFLAVIQRTLHYHTLSANAISPPVVDSYSSQVSLTAEQEKREAERSKLENLYEVATQCWWFLKRYGAQLGCVVMLFVALLRNSIWSVAHALTVGMFMLSGDAPRALKARQTKSWLKTMALMLMFAPLSACLLDLWFPPNTIRAPDRDAFGNSLLCHFFEPDVYRTDDGKGGCDYEDSGCWTQKQRCGEDWSKWFLLARGSTPEFCAFFLVCLIRRADVLLMGRRIRSTDDEGDGEEESDGDDGNDDASETEAFEDLASFRDRFQQYPSENSNLSAEQSPRPLIKKRGTLRSEWNRRTATIKTEDQTYSSDQTDEDKEQQILGIDMSFRITNVDDQSLFEEEDELDKFMMVIKTAIADIAGHGLEARHQVSSSNISLRCTPHFDMMYVQATIQPPQYMSYAWMNKVHSSVSNRKNILVEKLAHSFDQFSKLALTPSQPICISDVKVEQPGYYLICFATVGVWFALFFAFLSQPQSDFIAMGYLYLLLYAVMCTGSATVDKDPVESFLRPMKYIGGFNFAIILLSLAFQCPSMPCPYPLQLDWDPPEGKTLTSFMSSLQCFKIHDRKDEGGVMLGVWIRCLGFSKHYTLGTTSTGVWTLVVFTMRLIQMACVHRWYKHLVRHLNVEKKRLEERAEWYSKKLLSRRDVQLRSWDIKRSILMQKLQRVAVHLDNVRSIWEGQRSTFSDEELYQHERENRIENLVLKSGLAPETMKQLLCDFDAEARVEETFGQPQHRSLVNAVDQLILKYTHHKDLFENLKITVEERDAQRQKCLEECRELFIDSRDGTKRVSALIQKETTEEEITKAVAEIRKRSIVGKEKSNSSVEVSPSRDRSNTSIPSRSPISRAQSGLNSEKSKKVDEGDLKTEQTWLEWFRLLCKKALNKTIDDAIFFREGDLTLRQHRRNNTIPVLFLKALLSRTHAILIFASALQFMVNRSLLSAGSVSGVIISCMSFPHVPWTFWINLQRYNVIVVFLKMAMQLPTFCGDGSTRFAANLFYEMQPCKDCDPEMVPFITYLGLQKVRDKKNEFRDCITVGSYFELLTADIFVCAVCLLCLVSARNSGRYNDTNDILKQFEAQDATLECMLEIQAENPQIMKARDSVAERKELHDLIVRQANLRNRADDDESDDDDDMSSEKQGRLRALVTNWTKGAKKKTHDYFVGTTRARRPALDLYPYRFFFALMCLLLLLVCWNKLTGSSRTFADTLANSNFSGSQAVALVVYITGIVMDRALYTWYSHDAFSGSEEDDDAEENRELGDQSEPPTPKTPGGDGTKGDGRRREIASRQRSREDMQSRNHEDGVPRANFEIEVSSPAEAPAGRSKAEAVLEHLRKRASIESLTSEVENAKVRSKSFFARLCGDARTAATTLQKCLVAIQLVGIHAGLMIQWGIAREHDPDAPITLLAHENAWTLFFYTCYISYLCLTSLQLRYDIHVMDGGIRMTHSTDFMNVQLFRIYCVLPFLHELRVLTDWTVTKTSLNFFMWMKLEDAHQNLYRVKLDMEYRQMTRHAERRPLWEKFLVGGLLLLALLLLLVGPVLFFSGLNWTLINPNPVTGGKLSIGIEVQPKGEEGGFRQFEIYSASQEKIIDRDTKEAKAEMPETIRVKNADELTYQEMVFPFSAESFWMVNKDTRQMMMGIVVNHSGKVFVTSRISCDRQVGGRAETKVKVQLTDDSINRVQSILAPGGEGDFDVKNLFPPYLRLNDGPKIEQFARDGNKTCSTCYDARLKLKNEESVFATWSVARDKVKSADAKKPSSEAQCDIQYLQNLQDSCRLSFLLMSEYVSASTGEKKSGDSTGGTSSLVAIYLTVVLTIGNIIRRLFVDASKRIIYEEMPETELLLDLCNGIYIARIQGNLKAEYDLYHELLRIYRSPELLLDVTKEKRHREKTTGSGRRGRCDVCNHMNSEGSKFCRMCGEALKDQSEAEIALIPRKNSASAISHKPKPKEGPKKLKDAVGRVLLRARQDPAQLQTQRINYSSEEALCAASTSAPNSPGLPPKSPKSRGKKWPPDRQGST